MYEELFFCDMPKRLGDDFGVPLELLHGGARHKKVVSVGRSTTFANTFAFLCCSGSILDYIFASSLGLEANFDTLLLLFAQVSIPLDISTSDRYIDCWPHWTRATSLFAMKVHESHTSLVAFRIQYDACCGSCVLCSDWVRACVCVWLRVCCVCALVCVCCISVSVCMRLRPCV